MYKDNRSGRILLKDGTTVLSSFGYARHVINCTLPDDVKVAEDYDSLAYDEMNHTSVSVKLADVNPEPQDHTHTTEDLEKLLSYIEKSHRFDGSEEQINRIEKELDYFERTFNIGFILSCYDLIKKFKKEGIVWGVGRGSSCASLICYILEINDINPLKFDIPFSELSKEMDE